MCWQTCIQEVGTESSWTSGKNSKRNLLHVTVHRDTFLTITQTRCTKFSNLFWNETPHVSDSSPVHHQEFFTVHTAMVYVIKPVWHIPLLYVQWKTPDDRQRNYPKHVEFHSKKKIDFISESSWFCYKKEVNLSLCTPWSHAGSADVSPVIVTLGTGRQRENSFTLPVVCWIEDY